MRLSFFSMLALGIASCSSDDNDNEEAGGQGGGEKPGMTKVVDKVSTTTTDEEFGPGSYQMAYDDKGRLIECDDYTITYNPTKVTFKTKYDVEGKYLSLIYNLNENGLPVNGAGYTFKYDNEGGLIHYLYSGFDRYFEWKNGNIYNDDYDFIEYTDTIYKGNISSIINNDVMPQRLAILADYGYAKRCKNLIKRYGYRKANSVLEVTREYEYVLDKEGYPIKIIEHRYDNNYIETYNIKWKYIKKG